MSKLVQTTCQSQPSLLAPTNNDGHLLLPQDPGEWVTAQTFPISISNKRLREKNGWSEMVRRGGGWFVSDHRRRHAAPLPCEGLLQPSIERWDQTLVPVTAMVQTASLAMRHGTEGLLQYLSFFFNTFSIYNRSKCQWTIYSWKSISKNCHRAIDSAFSKTALHKKKRDPMNVTPIEKRT